MDTTHNPTPIYRRWWLILPVVLLASAAASWWVTGWLNQESEPGAYSQAPMPDPAESDGATEEWKMEVAEGLEADYYDDGLSLEEFYGDYWAGMIPDAPEGGVEWRLLENVRWVQPEGQLRYEPEFSEEILALDGTEVTLRGFMQPLEAAPAQKRFLFSGLPPSCPSCVPGGTNMLIDVHCADSIIYDWDAIDVRGRLTLLYDDQLGLLYRMDDAVQVELGE